MSKLKAGICSILLMIVMFGLLFASVFIKVVDGMSLYHILASIISGSWIADKVIDFYDWLQKQEGECNG